MLKAMVLTAGLAAVVAAVIGWGLALSPAGAQDQYDGPPPPDSTQAVNGPNPGEAVVSWTAVNSAAYYRVGWVAYDDYNAARAAGTNWLEAFTFVDLLNRGQATHKIARLTPGIAYAFIVGSSDSRYAPPAWSAWASLTLAAAASPCPTNDGEPPPPPSLPALNPTPTATPTPPTAPTPSPTPTPTPTHTPTGTSDYDADQDGLIEVSNLAQLAAIRADLNGDGVSPVPAYAAAFPNAMPGMGCPVICTGYELVADLDFDTNGNGKADAGDAYWNDGAGWIPIGDLQHQFTADFDGNNHTIANLYINSYINRSEDYDAGLFGYASRNSIKQVGIISATVSGSGNAGGLIGSHNGGTVSDSYATGSVSSSHHVGGLVGASYDGAISGSYAAGVVSGGQNAGGLVGRSRYSAISDSYAISGQVSGDYGSGVGGLVGESYGGVISGSYAIADVSNSNIYVGGLVGWLRAGGIIRASYAAGNVSGNDYVGGLVGANYTGAISDSYAIADVLGSGHDIGGLVGRNESGAVIDSYAAGWVSTTGNTFYIGGLVGYDQGYDQGSGSDIAASYWDTQITGQDGSYGGGGKTTAELQAPTESAGIYANWNPDYWDFGNAGQYPVLKYGRLDAAAQRH